MLPPVTTATASTTAATTTAFLGQAAFAATPPTSSAAVRLATPNPVAVAAAMLLSCCVTHRDNKIVQFSQWKRKLARLDSTDSLQQILTDPLRVGQWPNGKCQPIYEVAAGVAVAAAAAAGVAAFSLRHLAGRWDEKPFSWNCVLSSCGIWHLKRLKTAECTAKSVAQRWEPAVHCRLVYKSARRRRGEAINLAAISSVMMLWNLLSTVGILSLNCRK